jgi:hypothetical protein
MNLLKAYVHQVVSYHPPAVRDELFAEIYDEICEEYADQLAENPALTEAEFLDAGKQHPMRFATQLASDSSSYLVGPQFYFSFLSVMKIGSTITAIIFLILAVIAALASGNHWKSFWQVFWQVPEALLWVNAVILGVFVALEKAGEKATWLENWKSSELKATTGHKTISHGESFFDLSLSTIALLWIFDIIHMPAVVRHNDAWIEDWLIMLPDWCWMAAVIMFFFDMGFSLLRLTRNLWTRNLRLTTIVTNILWLVLLGYVVSQPQLLDIIGSGPKAVTDLIPLINKVLKGGLTVTMIIIAWDTVSHAWRLRRS